jgi:iron complex transport system ATP-binding protein
MNQSRTPLLLADNVSFSFGDQFVLQALTLAVGAGELVGLVGANGSGKSTLLRVLLGLLPTTAGNVSLCGAPLRSLSRREIATRATMVSQDNHIEFDFTAREIVAMGRMPYRGRFASETNDDRDAIQRAMRATDTEKFAERIATELSGGERQRVHLARALAQQTRVLLLDEPTANLDLAHQVEALCLVAQAVREDRAALVVLHDLGLATLFCDRLLLLAGGSIVAEGPPDEIVTEENLMNHFGLQARVRRDDETGGLHITPIGPKAKGAQCVGPTKRPGAYRDMTLGAAGI